jgi:hypothetical protein
MSRYDLVTYTRPLDTHVHPTSQVYPSLSVMVFGDTAFPGMGSASDMGKPPARSTQHNQKVCFGSGSSWRNCSYTMCSCHPSSWLCLPVAQCATTEAAAVNSACCSAVQQTSYLPGYPHVWCRKFACVGSMPCSSQKV